MNNTLMSPTRWAQHEFGNAELGDKRRTRRLVALAEALAKNPSGTLPGALPAWKDLKAAYRLLDQKEVTLVAILDKHWNETRRVCSYAGQYLWIEDTTTLDFSSHYALEDVGRVGDDYGRGLFLHTTLALRVESSNIPANPEVAIVGLAGQECWVRSEKLTGGGVLERERKTRRLSRARESQRWARVLSTCRPASPHAQCIYVADRESDIYEVFGRCRERNFDFIVRANQARALEGNDRSVFEEVAASAELAQSAVKLRTRSGTEAREAILSLRAVNVTLRGPYRPGGSAAPLSINVVEAREVQPPPGVEAIGWVLLTSLDIGGVDNIRSIIGFYTRRWVVEEYHKALKSGAQIECSQLEKRRRIEALLGVLALVALRLLETKLIARAQPERLVRPEQIGPEILQLLAAKFGTPAEGWTHQRVLIGIARMGGFLARKHDGHPGWQTIWRGWHRLITMTEGLQILEQ